jgi:hypothetical protein
MLSLTNHQLEVITKAATDIPVEKRAVYLERVAAMLTVRGRFSDDDVRDVASLALCGLTVLATNRKLAESS